MRFKTCRPRREFGSCSGASGSRLIALDGSGDLDAQLRARLHVAGVRLVDKAGSWHQRGIAAALRVLSGGRNRRYLTHVVTTIGRTVYVPPDFARWPRDTRDEILRHELVHVAQFARYGLVPMALAYLLLPLPIGLAWCRMRLEREAYEESIRIAFARGGLAETGALRESIVCRFTGPEYLWMWPFRRSVERWYDDFVDQLSRHPSS